MRGEQLQQRIAQVFPGPGAAGARDGNQVQYARQPGAWQRLRGSGPDRFERTAKPARIARQLHRRGIRLVLAVTGNRQTHEQQHQRDDNTEDQDGRPRDQARGQQDQQDQEQQQQDQQQQEQEQQQQDQQQAPPEEQEQPSEPEEQPAGEQEQQMSPEEAMRLLQALDADEEELRKSIQRRLRGDEKETEHDW